MTRSIDRPCLFAVFAAFCLLLGLTGADAASAADLSVNRFFSDGLVIQRDQPVTIAGSADKGAEVTVSLAGQHKTTKADDQGQWRVTLDAMAANTKPQKLTVRSAGKTVTVNDVLVGDVILFARQARPRSNRTTPPITSDGFRSRPSPRGSRKTSWRPTPPPAGRTTRRRC